MAVETEEVYEVRLISRAPLGQIPVLDWLAWPEAQALARLFADAQADMRFVGGCVRDAIAKRPVSEVDVATNLTPDNVIKLLESAGHKAIPTGIEHGTVTAVIGERSFEITTLRRDLSTDGRHAEVEFTDDWVEDAKRRDFTFNAMSCTPDGDVFDPFEGMRDLARGVVRFVGRADDRVQEDYLRILRYFRFWGYYGRPPADKNALSACRNHAAKLQQLSGERIRDELFKILTCPQPADVAVMMRGYGVLAQILPEAGDVNRLRVTAWLVNRGLVMAGVEADPIRHLAALLDTDEAGAGAVAGRLKLSNRQTARLIALAAPPEVITPEDDARTRERMIRRVGREIFSDLTLLAWAREVAQQGRLPQDRSAAFRDLLEFGRSWDGAPFPLKGQDLLDLGLQPGPDVGEALRAVEVWWEEGGYNADRDACLVRARRLIGGEE